MAIILYQTHTAPKAPVFCGIALVVRLPFKATQIQIGSQLEVGTTGTVIAFLTCRYPLFTCTTDNEWFFEEYCVAWVMNGGRASPHRSVSGRFIWCRKLLYSTFPFGFYILTYQKHGISLNIRRYRRHCLFASCTISCPRPCCSGRKTSGNR